MVWIKTVYLVSSQEKTPLSLLSNYCLKPQKKSKVISNLYSLSNSLIFDDDLPKLSTNGREFTLPKIATELFEYLKYQAEKALISKVEKTVASIPTYFDDSAKGQALLATKIVGINGMLVVWGGGRLIAKPVATAYAYGLNLPAKRAYLVYDLGGGTFDVSILNMQTGVLQVVAISEDNLLGGDDIYPSLIKTRIFYQ